MSDVVKVLSIVSELQAIKAERDSCLKDTQADAQRRMARKRLLRKEFRKIVGDKIYAEWLEREAI